jgi:hypothetical protein
MHIYKKKGSVLVSFLLFEVRKITSKENQVCNCKVAVALFDLIWFGPSLTYPFDDKVDKHVTYICILGLICPCKYYQLNTWAIW